MSFETSIRTLDLQVTDVIEFRRAGAGRQQRVHAVINGTELTQLWHGAVGRWAAPIWSSVLGPSLEWWGPNGKPPPAALSEWVPVGYAPVLTCRCGDFACGGALAQIRFDRRLVIWANFKTAKFEKDVPLGPFIFGRRAYEVARDAS